MLLFLLMILQSSNDPLRPEVLIGIRKLLGIRKTIPFIVSAVKCRSQIICYTKATNPITIIDFFPTKFAKQQLSNCSNIMQMRQNISI